MSVASTESISSSYVLAGKRQVVKLTPMQPLITIVEHISKAANQQLDPSTCKLFHNKKELDASTPVRFANIPSGATLELRTGTG